MNEDPLGFVETPAPVADELALETTLGAPKDDERILYPGAGRGNIAAAVHRHCSVRGREAPDAVFVERDEQHLDALEERFVGEDAPDNNGVPELWDETVRTHTAYQCAAQCDPVHADVEIRHADFLADPPEGPFDFILANPPYTAYQHIDEGDRERYAEEFDTAWGQFPLYAPFVEQMLDLLAPDGVLAALLPIQWLTTQVCECLRNRIRQEYPTTVIQLPERAFPEHAVVPTKVVVGRAEAEWVGDPSPPSQTRFYVTHVHPLRMEGLLLELGVDETDLDDAVAEYKSSVGLSKKLVRHRDKRERGDLDPADAGRQQPLARWSG